MGCACRPIHFPPPTAASSFRSFPSLSSISFPSKHLHIPKPHSSTPNNYNNPLFSFPNNNNNNNNNNNGGNNGGGDWGGSFNSDNDDDSLFSIFNQNRRLLLFLISSAASVCSLCALGALDNAKTGETIFEIKGGKKIELLPDFEKDEFVAPRGLWQWVFDSSKGNLSARDDFRDRGGRCGRGGTRGTTRPRGCPRRGGRWWGVGMSGYVGEERRSEGGGGIVFKIYHLPQMFKFY